MDMVIRWDLCCCTTVACLGIFKMEPCAVSVCNIFLECSGYQSKWRLRIGIQRIRSGHNNIQGIVSWKSGVVVMGLFSYDRSMFV